MKTDWDDTNEIIWNEIQKLTVVSVTWRLYSVAIDVCNAMLIGINQKLQGQGHEPFKVGNTAIF